MGSEAMGEEDERHQKAKSLSRRVASTKKTVEDYIHDMQIYGDVPKDQFGHQYKLLFHQQAPPKSQMDLLPPDAILGGAKDSKTLFLLQKDNELLNRFYDMGERSAGVMDVFDSLYYSWWQQMRMTGMLGFTERWLQSFLEPIGVPYESFSYLEKQKAKKAAKKGRGIRGYIDQIRGGGGGGEESPYE